MISRLYVNAVLALERQSYLKKYVHDRLFLIEISDDVKIMKGIIILTHGYNLAVLRNANDKTFYAYIINISAYESLLFIVNWRMTKKCKN